MKFFFSLLLFVLFQTNLISQTNTQEPDSSIVYALVDQMPQFPGGAEELEKYIKENRQYPAKTKKEDKEGSCYVQAVVEKDGRLTDIHLLRGIIGKKDLNEDALRIVNSMPNWIPGKQNNKLVRVTTIIVIYY